MPKDKRTRKPIPKPGDAEEARLRALAAYDILDSSPEGSFDDLALLAAHICGTPTALVSLVDRERQWFKARFGFDEPQTAREVSFCARAIEAPHAVMVVNDASKDPRFAQNPLVTRPNGIRFYAGAPLLTPEGQALGTICVIDTKPRELSLAQTEALRALARQVVMLMEMRALVRDLKKLLRPKKVAAKRVERKPAGLEELAQRVSLVETYMAEPSLLGMALKPPEEKP